LQSAGKVFVGNLPTKSCSDDLLRSAFKKFGGIESAEVVPERNSVDGKGRGIAFVLFDKASSVAAALAAMGTIEMHGRKLTIAPVERGRDGRGRDAGGPCFGWTAGDCRFGDKCVFAHEGPGGCVAKVVRKKCYAFKKGKCTKGDACEFKHVAESATAVAAAALKAKAEGAKGAKGAKSTLKGGGLCFAFKEGKCAKGDECRFAHSDKDTADTGPAAKRKAKALAKAAAKAVELMRVQVRKAPFTALTL
jgi:hypothetical protein